MKLDFVVGTGRCGSSLVHEVLARHEQVGFISNVEDNLPWLPVKGRLNNPLYALTQGSWTRKGGLRFAPSEAFRLIASKVSPIYENSCRDLLAQDVTPWLREEFTRFFEVRWRAQRRSHFLHKYTGWSRIGFFAEIFPQARFIHIVRDGRAVANSWLQMGWWGGYRGPEHWPWGRLQADLEKEWRESDQSFVVLAGLCWRLLMESFERATVLLGADRYLEIRYEDFLGAPTKSLRAITDFIELPSSRRLNNAIQNREFDLSRQSAYERDLTPLQLRALEQHIRSMLHRHGYLNAGSASGCP